MDKKYMGSKEAAKYLCIGEGTLNGWRTEGKGPPYYKLNGLKNVGRSHWSNNGRRILYSIKDLDEWVEKQPKYNTR
jgi:hypothetical protein